jgi:hypothetical protein
MLIPKIGEARASSRATASERLSTGRFSTACTIALQNRPSGFAASSERRPTIGIRPLSTRSPSTPSIAGKRVAEAMTETIPTMIAPTARLRMIELGTISMPNIAITKVVPLKSTALLAVFAQTSTASSFSRPFPRSSRKRETTKSA